MSSCGSSILVELEFGDAGFCGGRKTRAPGEKPSEQGENQQQTQPTYGNGRDRTRGATLVGGKRSRHSALHAPLKETS